MINGVHWTEKSVDDFVNRLSFEFITQLAKKMDSLPLKRVALAKRLGLTEGRVSQIFNNPGNLTLSRMIEYARVLGMKVAVVAYDDGDPRNERGPISSEIFSISWKRAGKPRDFMAVRATEPITIAINNERVLEKENGNYKSTSVTGINIDRSVGIPELIVEKTAETTSANNSSSMSQLNAS